MGPVSDTESQLRTAVHSQRAETSDHAEDGRNPGCASGAQRSKHRRLQQVQVDEGEGADREGGAPTLKSTPRTELRLRLRREGPSVNAHGPSRDPVSHEGA